MSQKHFAEYFRAATGNAPYGYQCRLACGPAADPVQPATLTAGAACQSQLINIPTGLGKTAAVTLAWLWNRVHRQDPAWPRRLVYCLPMRTLVEQTHDNVRLWLRAAGQLEWDNTGPHTGKVGVHILMGGKDDGEWDLYPEENAILIGTQDMLLSRALNRGYGMSRYRWPMHFGLLNNDALWVMDETQLMGVGLWTSSQLDWLRHDRFKPANSCATWWMSATIGTAFLETKDRKDAQLPVPANIEITDAEAETLDVLKAVRPVSSWQSPEAKDRKDRAEFIRSLATAIRNEHKTHTLSLVVCNTVAAAQEIYAALKSKDATTEIILLTSRFRPADRKAHFDKLLAFEATRKVSTQNGSPALVHEGLICVSTQIVEAGVDICSRRLWVEHAPWPSTLQRLGRLNRDGSLNNDAAAYVFEIPAGKGHANVSPYEPDDLKVAKRITDALAKKSGAAPVAPIREILLELSRDGTGVQADIAKSLEPKPSPFPRAFEVHELFSTEPDAFGGFTDVSVWVRGGDKSADVTIFWRDWDAAEESPNCPKFAGPVFHCDEGCAVAIHRVREFVKGSKMAFIWNDHVERWTPIKHDEICPGMVVMLAARSGGYDGSKGWTGDKADKPSNAPPPGPFDAEGSGDKQTTAKSQWVVLDAHLRAVTAECQKIANTLTLPAAQKSALARAAALHDIGKSFPQWQGALATPRPDETVFWAKAPSFAERAGMRHEAASALAAWRRYYRDRAADFPALTVYLIAAHHGIIRTALGSRPAPAKQPNVAGIPVTVPPPALPWHEQFDDNWQLDFTPASEGTDGAFSENANGELIFTPSTPGWSALIADLLGGWEADAPHASAGAVPANDISEPQSLKPFQLAYLEALLRAADCRVSASEGGISITETSRQ